MIKKTVQYMDFNGDMQNEDIYFNLTKAEIAELELSQAGGLTTHIQKIIDATDNKEIIELVKSILLKSVGRRSEDGKRFIKNDTIREEFISSEAYSTIFMDLAFNENSAIEFFNGIMPADLMKKAEELNMTKNA